jgi:membrane protein DedA with SNARE-associated domain
MTAPWEALNHALRTLLDTHPLVVIAVILFFEELGVPSPIPGDLLMMLAGVKVAQGVYPLWLVLAVQELVTLAGTCGLYTLSRRLGPRLLARYGRFLHLSPEAVARAEERIRRWGGRAIVLGRLLPGLRIVTPIAAGALGVPFRQFLPAVALGAFLYLLFYTLLGVFLGPPALALFERVSRSASALVSLAALIALLVVTRRVKRELPAPSPDDSLSPGAGALAGLLAGVAALLATNGLVGLVSLGARLLGRPVPEIATTLRGVAETSTGLQLLLGWPGFLAATTLLGLLLSRLGRAGRPWRARVALVAGLPLLLNVLVLAPFVGRHSAELDARSGALVLAVAALRWLAFGLLLDDVLPMATRLRQAVPAAPAAS